MGLLILCQIIEKLILIGNKKACEIYSTGHISKLTEIGWKTYSQNIDKAERGRFKMKFVEHHFSGLNWNVLLDIEFDTQVKLVLVFNGCMKGYLFFSSAFERLS